MSLPWVNGLFSEAYVFESEVRWVPILLTRLNAKIPVWIDYKSYLPLRGSHRGALLSK